MNSKTEMMDLDMNVSHPHQCDQCQFSTSHLGNLNIHKSRAHPVARTSTRMRILKRPHSPPRALPSQTVPPPKQLDVIRAEVLPNIESQVQSLLDIIELILNKIEHASMMDLKSVLEESINEIVAIKNNLTDLTNSNENGSDEKDDHIYFKFSEEENNIKNDLNDIRTSNEDGSGERDDHIYNKFYEEENNIFGEEEGDNMFGEEEDNTREQDCNPNKPSVSISSLGTFLREEPIVINVKKSEEIQKNEVKSPLYLCPANNCDKSFKKVTGETGFLKHMEINHDFKKEDLLCPMCSRQLSSKESLTHHIKKVHNQNLDLECKICLKVFTKNQGYHLHMNSSHGKGKKKKKKGGRERVQIHSCAACSYTTNNKEEMVCHKVEEHGIERSSIKKYNIACEFCGFREEDVDRDQHVLENHVIDGKYHCPSCNFIAEDEDSLRKHCNNEHKLEACFYQCPDIDCGKQFRAVRGIQGLVRHMENFHNHNFEESECPMCFMKSKHRSSLIQHIISCHSNMDLQCKKCFKTMTSSDGYKFHMLSIHGNLMKLMCDICGFSTKSKFTMERHKLREHSTEGKQINCPECPQMFYTNHDLNTHMKRKHVDKNYLCTQCDFATKTNSNLKKHMEGVHGSQERNFSCHICGNDYKTDKHLKDHLESHSIDKKYKCDHCGKAFAQKKYLQKHVAIHEGKYRGHCNTCNKSFVQFCNYKLHMMKHHQVKVQAPER